MVAEENTLLYEIDQLAGDYSDTICDFIIKAKGQSTTSEIHKAGIRLEEICK